LINIQANVDRKMLLDILSDGMDYVCRGYWGQINKYKWYWWYVCDENGEPDTDKINPALTGDTVLIQLRDDMDGEADDEDRPWTDITLNKMEEAFGWALENYSHTIVPYEITNDETMRFLPTITECNYDAVTGDVILQRIVLGEVVYG